MVEEVGERREQPNCLFSNPAVTDSCSIRRRNFQIDPKSSTVHLRHRPYPISGIPVCRSRRAKSCRDDCRVRPDDDQGVRLKLVNQGVVAADSSDILIADKHFVTVGVTDDLLGKAGDVLRPSRR